MTEYTIASETELSDPVAADYIHVYDASAAATKKLSLAAVGSVGAGVVDTTATTLTITAASHAGKSVTISSTAPIAVTLPQATGTGNRYRFHIRVVATATSHTIKVANATDVMAGVVHVSTTATTTNVAAIVAAFHTTDTSDTISINGTTLGGLKDDWFEIVDIKTGFFQVYGITKATGTYATPFSAAVP
jgi:hypothetical protein